MDVWKVFDDSNCCCCAVLQKSLFHTNGSIKRNILQIAWATWQDKGSRKIRLFVGLLVSTIASTFMIFICGLNLGQQTQKVKQKTVRQPLIIS